MTDAVEIKEFEYYIVFKDSNNNYIMGYGYPDAPTILDMKYAFDTLSKDQELVAAIPDFHRVFDYISVDVMKHKKFIKYMSEQEEKLRKAEAKKGKVKSEKSKD